MNLFTKIVNLIKQARVSKVDSDSSSVPKAQVEVNGKTTNAIRMSCYGVCSNPPEKSNVVLINSNANEACKYALIDYFNKRFKNLKEGEVVIYNYLSGAYSYFKEDGSIEVYSPASITATAVTSATITAPTITLNGNTTVVGTFTQTGGGASSFSGTLGVTGDATIDGDSFRNHTHSGVETGTGNTGIVN